MKRKSYQFPFTKVVSVETENFICVSGKMGDWTLDKDDSDEDDWSDDDDSNNSKPTQLSMRETGNKGFFRSMSLCSCLLVAFLFSTCSSHEEVGRAVTVAKSGYEVSLDVEIEKPKKAAAKEMMSRIAVTEDEVSGLKTTWEDGDKLTVAYRSGGVLKTTQLSVVSTNGRSATFHGSVESSSDAQAFRTSTLYAVNDNASDKISTSISGNKLKVRVDFSRQTGEAGKIADYDLLYAEGQATSGLRFAHKVSVMRLDIVSASEGSSGNAISGLSLIYVPSTSTSKSVFAKSAEFEFGDASTSTYDGATFFQLSNLSIPFVNGKAAVYAVLPANDEKLTGELSVRLEENDGRVFRKHINLTGKSFPTHKVVAKTIRLKTEHRIPNIGDYLYSDGTWGPLAYYADKFPMALVFSNYTSEADRQKGYKHGYAVALRDAAWPTPWSPDNEDYPEAENVFEHIGATAPLTMMKNLDGLTTCQKLNTEYLSNYTYDNYYNHGGKKAAIPLAMEYGKQWWRHAYTGSPEVPVPTGTSGWYLLSIGQWFMMFTNLTGLNPNDLIKGADQYGQVYTLSWTFSSASEKRKYLDKFTKYFDSNSNPILKAYYESHRIPEITFYLPADGQSDWYLWTCDEAKSGGYACCVHLSQTAISFTYLDKRSGENSLNGYAARSVIAF